MPDLENKRRHPHEDEIRECLRDPYFTFTRPKLAEWIEELLNYYAAHGHLNVQRVHNGGLVMWLDSKRQQNRDSGISEKLMAIFRLLKFNFATWNPNKLRPGRYCPIRKRPYRRRKRGLETVQLIITTSPRGEASD
jgi:hypothetical protein